ncbi:MAG: glutaminyl-peptide cyclotransferase [Oscillochloridaceae bacterium umkhey_bin13]
MPVYLRRSLGLTLLLILLAACGLNPVASQTALPGPSPTTPAAITPEAYPLQPTVPLASPYPDPQASGSLALPQAYPGPALVDPGHTSPQSSGTPIRVPEVVAIYPHDQRAFTQGLVYLEEDRFYESTGLYGQSSLREVSLQGEQLRPMVRLPDQYFAEGIAVFDATIFQLTWQACVGFLYDRELTLIGQFAYQDPPPLPGQRCFTEGWGLTNDQTRLIMSNGSDTLFFVDPVATKERGVLAITGQIQVYDDRGPVRQLNELEYINGLIYANIWYSDLIARIDPNTGRVVDYLDLSGLRALMNPDSNLIPPEVLNGIAYDPQRQRLFVIGKLWSNLFELTLPMVSGRQIHLPMIQL